MEKLKEQVLLKLQELKERVETCTKAVEKEDDLKIAVQELKVHRRVVLDILNQGLYLKFIFYNQSTISE